MMLPQSGDVSPTSLVERHDLREVFTRMKLSELLKVAGHEDPQTVLLKIRSDLAVLHVRLKDTQTVYNESVVVLNDCLGSFQG